MKTESIVMEREDALALYREYRKSRCYETKIDAEIKATYRAIAQGKVVIKALASIANAGLGDDTFPKLALTRADATHCRALMREDGGATMVAADRRGSILSRAQDCNIGLPAGTFRNRDWPREKLSALAIVPRAPLHLRPRTNI